VFPPVPPAFYCFPSSARGSYGVTPFFPVFLPRSNFPEFSLFSPLFPSGPQRGLLWSRFGFPVEIWGGGGVEHFLSSPHGSTSPPVRPRRLPIFSPFPSLLSCCTCFIPPPLVGGQTRHHLSGPTTLPLFFEGQKTPLTRTLFCFGLKSGPESAVGVPFRKFEPSFQFL